MNQQGSRAGPLRGTVTFGGNVPSARVGRRPSWTPLESITSVSPSLSRSWDTSRRCRAARDVPPHGARARVRRPRADSASVLPFGKTPASMPAPARRAQNAPAFCLTLRIQPAWFRLRFTNPVHCSVKNKTAPNRAFVIRAARMTSLLLVARKTRAHFSWSLRSKEYFLNLQVSLNQTRALPNAPLFQDLPSILPRGTPTRKSPARSSASLPRRVRRFPNGSRSGLDGCLSLIPILRLGINLLSVNTLEVS